MYTIVWTILLFIVGLLFFSVLYFLYTFTYWWRRNIFYLKPSIPFGNYNDVIAGKQQTSIVSQQLYHKIKATGRKYGGIYFLNSPVLMPTDPTLIKRILSTDFEYFSDRGVYFNEEKDPLGYNLFGLPVEPWRQLRNKLTPAFSSGKIKNMFDITLSCANRLVEAMEGKLDQPIEINDLAMRYSVDNIGRTAYGIDCNSLKNPNELFRKIAEDVINPPMFDGIKFFMGLISPTFLKLFNMTVIQKHVSKFFLDIVEQNIKFRESNNIQRVDFFQLMLEMKQNDEKMEGNSLLKMTPKVMAAQAFVFFAAGFETSSMTINSSLFELSQNIEIQDKLRAEIKKVMKNHGGKLTYDGLKEMMYLDQCMQETLRKYPALGFLNRECMKNYTIAETGDVIEKGTKVMISIRGLQNDPDYFPNPEKFDPDRFSPENKEKIPQFTHMPFGEGHRICIGMRFGMIQTKVCLASLINNFEFRLSPITKIPLEYVAHSFVLSLKNGLYLNVNKV